MIGQALSMDFKPIGGFCAITAQDLYTGLLFAFPAHREDAESAIQAFQHLLGLGLSIQTLLLDRAKAFLLSENFRSILAAEGCEPIFSKGHDPRHISSLERAHAELNAYFRSFGPVAEDDFDLFRIRLNRFLSEFNALELSCGITRRELAYGTAPIRQAEINRRLRTLTQSLEDSQRFAKPDSHMKLAPGTIAHLKREPKSKRDAKAELVEILSRYQGSALVRSLQGRWPPKYVPTRRLTPRLQVGSPSAPYTPVTEDINIQTESKVDLIVPKKGEWIVYVDNRKPNVGIVTDPGNNGCLLQETRHVKGQWVPVWCKNGNAITAKSRPRAHAPMSWQISLVQVLGKAPRPSHTKFSLPESLQQIYAEAERRRPETIYAFKSM
jgi:hypothetical protein